MTTSKSHDFAVLEGLFRGDEKGSAASPSSVYQWARKRSEIRRLCSRNLDRLQAAGPVFADFGAGRAKDLFMMRTLLGNGWRYIGVDGSPVQLAQAEARREYHEATDVEFVRTDITKRLPFEDGEIGVSYTSETIEHIPDPESYLAELRRVTSGYLFFTTPNQPNPFQRSFYSPTRRREVRKRIDTVTYKNPKRFDGVEIYGHVSLRTVKGWDRALRGAGFELLDSGRGGLFDASRGWRDREAALAAMFAAQAVLDVFPRKAVRALSNQTIGLYRAV